MTIQQGRFVGATEDEILQVLMANATVEFGDDLNTNQLAVIRTFYRPVASLLADVQTDISEVMDSAQLEYAEGDALDLLVELIGVYRRSAVASTGTATFSRDSAAGSDYTIPDGTRIQTDQQDPIRFETTETATLSSGTTEVTGVPIKAVEPGKNANLGSNTLTVMTDPPTGIESVTNPAQTDGGEDRENDTNLRERAKDELANGMVATAIGVRNQLLKTENVRSVTLNINDESSEAADGLDSHHVEYIVEGGADADVGQTIFESKAAAGGTEGGLSGTEVTYQADVGNGQTHPVAFSRPATLKVYVDMELATTDEYAGDDTVRDRVVQYIGGLLASGDEASGDLLAGDDVIYNQVLSDIIDLDGISDVPVLEIGTSTDPTGTSNVSVAPSEVATVDATDGTITITEV